MTTTLEKATVTATLAIDRETKNTYRYAETEDSEAAGAIGTLYLSKYVATRVLGENGERPERISVTVVAETLDNDAETLAARDAEELAARDAEELAAA